VKSVDDQNKMRLEFQTLIQNVEKNHKEELSKLQQKADLEAEDRRRQEKDMADKFNTQIQLIQKQSQDAQATQISEFSKIQKETESKQKEALQLVQAGLQGPLSVLQGEVGKLANGATGAVGGALGGATDLLGGLTGGLLGPLTGLLGGLGGGGGGGSPSILKLELCSVM